MNSENVRKNQLKISKMFTKRTIAEIKRIELSLRI